MSEPVLRDVVPSPGYPSREVGLVIAQLDDLSVRLAADTRDITPVELEWQSAPGMNTIGMLLVHLALAEVWWTELVLRDVVEPNLEQVIGMGVYDDGMPVEADAPFTAPPHLAGRTIEYYDDLLARARRHLRRVAEGIDEDALSRRVTRTHYTGMVRTMTVRWTLQRLLEHLPWHYGQILLIRHQYRMSAAGARGGAGAA